MQFTYHFVRMGETAPEEISKNQFWLDVGNKADIGVIDHHHQKRKEWSAAELFRNTYKEFILPNIGKSGQIDVYLHQNPDLDAIFCAWLLKKVCDGFKIETDLHIQEMIYAVSENDQGYCKPVLPEENWAVVFRLVLNTSETRDDISLVNTGLDIIEQTYEILKSGKSLEYASQKVLSIKARIAVKQAYRDYLDDLSRAIIFQVRLPKKSAPGLESECPGIHDIHSSKEVRWCLADAVYFKEPKSLLFKEYARSDKTNSKLKLGFTLMITACGRGIRNGNALTRYTISTDPYSGLHLQGIGKMLEQAEQKFEDDNSIVLFNERQRVELGKGRWPDVNVISPWYDGRGHDYTIVDSPSITLNGSEICASQLTEKIFLNLIWEYGDPARFVHAENAEIFVLLPVKVKKGKTLKCNAFADLKNYSDDFSPEVYSTFEIVKSRSSIQIGQYDAGIQPEIPGFFFKESLLVYLDNYNAVLISKYAAENQRSLRSLMIDLEKIKRIDPDRVLCGPAGKALKVSFSKYMKILLACSLKSEEISFEDISPALMEILHRITGDFSYTFFDRPSKTDLDTSAVHVSKDHKRIFFANQNGFSLCQLDHLHAYSKPALKTAITLSLVMLQKISIKNVFYSFILHRSVTVTNKKIIADRWRLMRIEQVLFYSKISESVFIQNAYEICREIMHITHDFNDAKAKIEILAQQAKDVRADFTQFIINIVTLLIAPVALTASFFSGIHFDKAYGEKFHSFLFTGSRFEGMWHFLAFFLGTVCISGLLFAAVKLLNSFKLKKKKF